MNHPNTHHGHTNGKTNAPAEPNCPTCGAVISADQYERILRIDEARKKALAEERAKLDAEREALESEHEALAEKSAEIAATAVEAARAKWDTDKARIVREFVRLQKEAAVEQQRIAREHAKAMKAQAAQSAAHQKKLEREVAVAEAKAKRAAEEDQKVEVDDLKGQLKTAEQRRARDEANFKKAIVELQRKAEARDRQHLGPEGEEALIAVLRADYPGDRVEHHGKGGDVLQYVMDRGREAGVVVFEVKNRTTWSADYVRQTQLAMEKHGTSYGILVSRTLPAPKTGLCVMRGVIVVAPVLASQVVGVVRDGMIAIYRLHLSEKDKGAKTVALFEYLRGSEFATAMTRVGTKLTELKASLAREKSSHEGTWRVREQHYTAIARETSAIDGRVRDLLGGPGVAKASGKANAVHPNGVAAAYGAKGAAK